MTYQIGNLHGDVIATASADPQASKLLDTFENDEFGVPKPEAQQGPPVMNRYQWLGGKERETQFASGVITMGVRVYVPQMGRFLQTDPVVGGSANNYDYANQDPINQLDLDGRKAKRRGRTRTQVNQFKSCRSGSPMGPKDAGGNCLRVSVTWKYNRSRNRVNSNPIVRPRQTQTTGESLVSENRGWNILGENHYNWKGRGNTGRSGYYIDVEASWQSCPPVVGKIGGCIPGTNMGVRMRILLHSDGTTGTARVPKGTYE